MLFAVSLCPSSFQFQEVTVEQLRQSLFLLKLTHPDFLLYYFRLIFEITTCLVCVFSLSEITDMQTSVSANRTRISSYDELEAS